MDDDRRIKIATALQQYRNTVSQHSLFLLRFLVEGIEAEPNPSRGPVVPTQVPELRRRILRRYLHGLPNSIEEPRDVLHEDVRLDLILSCGLDGVSHDPVDLQQRSEYFAAVRTRIGELNVAVTEFPPADLEYLCTLVSGVTGPGLPYRHEAQQFDFVTPLRDAGPLDAMLENVIIPFRDNEDDDEAENLEKFNSLTYVWQDWEIALAFKVGGGPRSWGGSWVLYCRNEGHEELKWRYGVHDGEWCSEVYDNVEDFLAYYAHFNEQTEEDIKKKFKPTSRAP